MKTIVFIDETAKIGGIETNLIQILPRLKREGWNPVVLLPQEGPLVERLRAYGISCLVVPGGPFYSISFYVGKHLKVPNPLAWSATLIRGMRWSLELARVLRQIQPEIVQTTSMLSHLFGGLAARNVGVPVVAHIQDIVAKNSGWGLYNAIFQAWAGKVPLRIVSISSLVAHQFQSSSSAMAKTQVIQYMVDLEKFQSPNASRELHKEVKIGTVARLTPWKGQHIALGVASLLKARGIHFQWQFAGDAALGDRSYAQDLHQCASRWQLKQEVGFLGWQEDTSRFYRSLDFLVHLPVEPEPFGLVIAEALSCGLPVIASHGGLDEIVQEAGGFLVPVGDAKSAADAIVDLIKRLPSQRVDFQQKARTTALKYFSPHTIIPQWLDLYEEMLTA